MAQKLASAIPDGLDLDQNYTIRFTAVDPTTGNDITTVNVSQASLIVANLAGTTDTDLQSGPFLIVPGPET